MNDEQVLHRATSATIQPEDGAHLPRGDARRAGPVCRQLRRSHVSHMPHGGGQHEVRVYHISAAGDMMVWKLEAERQRRGCVAFLTVTVSLFLWFTCGWTGRGRCDGWSSFYWVFVVLRVDANLARVRLRLVWICDLLCETKKIHWPVFCQTMPIPPQPFFEAGYRTFCSQHHHATSVACP